MLRTAYHHLGDSWKWAREGSDFTASLFYSSISGVSKWFFLQALLTILSQAAKFVHRAGTIGGRVNLSMDNPYVLITSQRLVVGWQRGEKPLHEVMIQRDVPV